MNWLAEHLVDVIVIAIIVVLVVLVLRRLIKDKRVGKTACGCDASNGFSSCSMGCSCCAPPNLSLDKDAESETTEAEQ